MRNNCYISQGGTFTVAQRCLRGELQVTPLADIITSSVPSLPVPLMLLFTILPQSWTKCGYLQLKGEVNTKDRIVRAPQ